MFFEKTCGEPEFFQTLFAWKTVWLKNKSYYGLTIWFHTWADQTEKWRSPAHKSLIRLSCCNLSEFSAILLRQLFKREMVILVARPRFSTQSKWCVKITSKNEPNIGLKCNFHGDSSLNIVPSGRPLKAVGMQSIHVRRHWKHRSPYFKGFKRQELTNLK